MIVGISRPSENDSRFTVLDSWRGICAVFIVLHHIEADGPIGSSAFIRGTFLFVDFFFVLSGFVIAKAYGSRLSGPREVAQFVLRRFSRVWPLHMAVLLLLVLMETMKLVAAWRWGIAFANAPFVGADNIAALPFNILLLHAMGIVPHLTWNTPSWSVGAEFWTYLTFAGIACFARARALAVSIVVVMIAAIWLVLGSHTLMDATYDFGYLRCVYGFFVGALLYACHDRYAWLRRAAGTRVEVLTIVFTFAFVTFGYASRIGFAAPIVFAVFVAVFAHADGVIARALRRPFLQHLGLWSYSIYMVHATVLFLVTLALAVGGRVATRVLPTMMLSAWTSANAWPLLSDAGALVYVAVVIGVASVSYRLIELPGQRAFGALAKRLAAPANGER